MLQVCRIRTLACLAVLLLMIGTTAAQLDSPRPKAAQAPGLEQQIQNELKAGSQILTNLTYLCDEIGPRLTGSANQRRASAWALRKMKEYGLENVHLEAWALPEGWERGLAQARVIGPDNGRTLSLASMAWAPGTPGKIEANVVALTAGTTQELMSFKGKLKGTVVLLGAPHKLPPLDKLLAPEKRGPSTGVPDKGPSRAGPDARAFIKERSEFLHNEGAAALFVDAGKPFGLLYTTGLIDSKDRPSAGNRLPTLYVAHNHYEMLYRLATRPNKTEPARIELDVRNNFIAGPIAVHNTVGEIRGTEKPDEVVVVGAHLDSWDLAQGATDNGTGAMTVLETARVLAKLGVKPRRTIRFILFTGEEQGLLGSRAYVAAHKDELPKISACLVHDTGTGKVTGIALKHRPVLQPLLERELGSLKQLGVTDFQAAFIGGSDHASFDKAGVPGLMFHQDPADYRLSHHSQFDTLDRIREGDVIQGAQVMALTALRIANLDTLLPRDKPKPPDPKKPEPKEKTSAGTDTNEIATVEGVTEYRLANGARVLLFPEASRPTLTVNMTVLVGSRHEGYGETGMAHLLEHMVFKGTPRHPDVPKALRDHGASFNGTTNVDRTNYFETLPATDDNLDFAIGLEADRLVNSWVKREHLASEMTVVRNEFERGENSPQGVLMERIHAAAYMWHNYGKSTIGNRSDIERVPIENLQAFYKKYYQPDNVVLIVAGKFDKAKALALVEKHLGAIPKPTRKLDDTYTEEPAQDGERQVVLRRVGKIGSVAVAYHIPAAAHADSASLSLLAGIISQQPNGRLYKALVESKKANSAGASAGNNHDPGLFMATSQAEPDQLDTVRATLLQTLENLPAVPFTGEEVAKAKLRSRRNQEALQANKPAMAQALSSASALGDWRLLFLQRDRLAAVTANDVNRVARTYFQKHNRTVGIYIPQEQPQRLAIEVAPDLDTLVKNYKGGTVAAAGEEFDPSPENLDRRTQLVELAGIKAGLLPKKNRGETVSLLLTLHYGNEESLQGKTTAAALLPGLMLAGTKQHDRQALREKLESLGIRISAGGGGGRGRRGEAPGAAGTPGQLTFSLEARRSTLPEAIKLLGEILREPAFPAAEFDTMKRRSLASARALRSEPSALASNRLARALSPYSPSDVRYVPTPEESAKRLEAVTLDEVIALYEKQVGATTGELAIVGDFDAQATLTQLRAILKDWKSDVPVRRIPKASAATQVSFKEDILTPDKANAVFMAGLAFPLKESDPDYAALRLGNFLVGGGTLSSRLGNRIRQKEGLSYGITSSFSADPRDSAATFTVNAITNPLNIDRLEKAVVEELTKFLAHGPTPTELKDGQRAYVEAQKVTRTADPAIAAQIATNLHLGRKFADQTQLEKRIAALTPEAVQAAFKKYIDPKKLVIIRAGDFKKQGEK